MVGTSLQYMYYWICYECLLLHSYLWLDLPGKHFARWEMQLTQDKKLILYNPQKMFMDEIIIEIYYYCDTF